VEVNAPWPGTVQEIAVSAGDRVERDQPLLTLEAMKMLTPILAPEAGTVGAVQVAVGDFVEERAVLLTLEAGGPA